MGEYAEDYDDDDYYDYCDKIDWRPNDFTPEYLWNCRELNYTEIITETSKAIFVECDTEKEWHRFWIPKSQTCNYKGKTYINNWFADKLENGEQEIEIISKFI